MKKSVEIHQRNLKLSEEKNNNLSLKVDNLTKIIKQKDEKISELKKENINLKSILQNFGNFRKRFSANSELYR